MIPPIDGMKNIGTISKRVRKEAYQKAYWCQVAIFPV
jgi:hypothetical protein